MTDRIARVWNGSAWEVITSTAAAPNAVVFYQTTAPSSPATGTVWVNPNNNQFSVWNGSSWIAAITTYTYQSTAPSISIVGQIWVNSTSGESSVWNGSTWISLAPSAYYQSSTPSTTTVGQVWINSTTNQINVYTGSLWKPIATPSGANAAISLNINTISENYTFPSGYNGISSGPITIDDGVIVTIPAGSDWSIV